MSISKQLTTIFWLILLFITTSYAQKAPIKWGKVPKEDLQMKIYNADSSAEAVVLCDYGKLEFDLSSGDVKYVMKRHKRIKILSEEGFDQADITIPYYSRNNGENVAGIDAQVILPDGSKQSIKNKEIFTEEKNRNWSLKKFTIPNLRVGCIIEYRYRIESEYYFSLPEWYYQEEIPVRYSELRTSIPEWYDYMVLNQGLKVTHTEESASMSRLMIPGVRTRTTTGITGRAITSTSQSGYDRIEAQVIHRRYIMENAPALRPENYVTTMENYLSRMRFQLRGVQFPQNPYHSVMGSWEQVAQEMMEHERFGAQINRKGKHKKALSETETLLSQAKTQQEKIQLLYNYLSQNFEWNGNYGVYTSSDLDDCFAKKAGHSGELNLLLLALLREHDIEAYPMLISTRSNGYPMQLYPILDQFNHVMVVAMIEGQSFIMDVHDPAYPINFPRESALSNAGWLLTEQPQWVNLTAPGSSTTMVGNFTINTEGAVSGKIQAKFEGYDAIDQRQLFRKYQEGKHWQDHLTTFHPTATVTNVKTRYIEKAEKPLQLSLDCEIEAFSQSAGDFIYLPPLVIPVLEDNPLQAEQRTYPVEMLHPFEEKYIFNYTIPEGFVLEELPEPAIISLPNNGGKITYMASDNGGKVQVLVDIQVNQTVYPPEEYEYIRSFFSLLLEKQGEQIILKKQT